MIVGSDVHIFLKIYTQCTLSVDRYLSLNMQLTLLINLWRCLIIHV